jgi:hypothetical protein
MVWYHVACCTAFDPTHASGERTIRLHTVHGYSGTGGGSSAAAAKHCQISRMASSAAPADAGVHRYASVVVRSAAVCRFGSSSSSAGGRGAMDAGQAAPRWPLLY